MLQIDPKFVQEVPMAAAVAAKKSDVIDMDMYRGKKVTRTAEIISVSYAPFINPQGQVLSGITRSGAPVHLAGTTERYKVTFRFEDDSRFEGIVGVFKNIHQYQVGSKGMLTVKKNEILAWEPFPAGTESEEALLPERQRKHRVKIIAGAAAGLLLIAAAVWLILMYGVSTPVSGVLKSEDGNAVNVTVKANRRMIVNVQGTHFMVVHDRGSRYRIELPTMAELDQELRKVRTQANDPDSGVYREAVLGGPRLQGEVYEIHGKVTEYVLYGRIGPDWIPLRITGTNENGKSVNIEGLASRLDFLTGAAAEAGQ